MKKILSIIFLLISTVTFAQIKVIKVKGQVGISKADSVNGYVTPTQNNLNLKKSDSTISNRVTVNTTNIASNTTSILGKKDNSDSTNAIIGYTTLYQNGLNLKKTDSLNVNMLNGGKIDTSHIPNEIITITHQGVGYRIINGSGDMLYAKSIQAGSGVTITPNSDSSLTISSTATGTGGISKLGSPTYGLIRPNDSTYVIDTTIHATSSNTGYLSNIDWSTFNNKENSLGNPSTNGYVLSSTTGGTRSWIANGSGGGDSTRMDSIYYVIDASLGDSLHDATNAINSAILLASATRGIVYIPAGRYIIRAAYVDTATVYKPSGIIMKSGVTLMGAGANTKIYLSNPPANATYNNTTFATNSVFSSMINLDTVTNCVIKDLYINGRLGSQINYNINPYFNPIPGMANATSAIKIISGSNNRVSNVSIDSMALFGIFNDSSIENTYDKLRITTSIEGGVYFYRVCNGSVLSNSIITNNNCDNVRIKSSNITINNNELSWTKKNPDSTGANFAGIYVEGDLGNSIYNVRILANYIHDNSECGIDGWTNGDTTILSRKGFSVDVENNLIEYNSNAGVKVSMPSMVIKGNSLNNNGANSNNSKDNHGYYPGAIYINSYSGSPFNLTFSNNTTRETRGYQKYGIFTDSSADHNSFTYNTIYGGLGVYSAIPSGLTDIDFGNSYIQPSGAVKNPFTMPVSSSYPQIQVGDLLIQGYGINNSWFGDNIYYNGTNFIRKNAGYGNIFYSSGSEGQFRFSNNGVAGSVVTDGIGGFGKVQFKSNFDGTTAIGRSMSGTPGTYTGADFILNGSTGNIGIGTITPNAVTILDVENTTKGVLFTPMTSSQFSSIASKPEGLQAYDLTNHKPTWYDGTALRLPLWTTDSLTTNLIKIAALNSGTTATTQATTDSSGKLATTDFAKQLKGIKAANDLTGQTAAGTIATHTVSAADASYDISGYINVTAISVDVLQFQVSYTDVSNTPRTVTVGANLTTTGDYSFDLKEVRCKASTTITVKTNQLTGGGSETFYVGATITKIR